MSAADSRNWDARYGWGLVAEHASGFEDCIAISSPSAWEIVAPSFKRRPVHLEFQHGMQFDYLQRLLERLPEARQVLAIGGGNALDVGKYVAWKTGRPLIMIPTIVSTGAIFQATVPVRHADHWEFHETVAPEYLLVDFGLIRSAPPHLNCAGMGECICQLAGVAAWRWWANRGLECPPWDALAAQTTIDWVNERAAQFSADLDSNGQPNETGIRIAAEVNRQRHDLPTRRLALSHNLDHVFLNAFEWVHRRLLLHGEAAALGSLINAHVYGWGFGMAKALLNRCRVRYRPSQIGCTVNQVWQVLERINELNDKLGHGQNWFHHCRLEAPEFAHLIDRIEAPATGTA